MVPDCEATTIQIRCTFSFQDFGVLEEKHDTDETIDEAQVSLNDEIHVLKQVIVAVMDPEAQNRISNLLQHGLGLQSNQVKLGNV